MKWYKRDPSAYLAGTRELTLEERAIYGDILELLYARDGDLPDDLVPKVCGIRPQMWRRIKAALIAKGKIAVKTDGKLTQNRVETELKLARNRIEQTEIARAKALEIKRTASQSTDGQPQPQPEKKEEEKREARKRSPSPKIPLPENWHPMEELTPSEALELEKMKDWARDKDIRSADWFARWRNWKRRAAEFNTGNGNGRGRSVLEAAERIIEGFGGNEAARRYVPGSAGPRPLELDRGNGPSGPKLISSR